MHLSRSVFESNASEVSVYLPNASCSWVHVAQSRKYPGGQWYNVSAPLGLPAVFSLTEPRLLSKGVWEAVSATLREHAGLENS